MRAALALSSLVLAAALAGASCRAAGAPGTGTPGLRREAPGRVIELDAVQCQPALRDAKRDRRRLAAAEDLVGCVRADARIEYLEKVDGLQAARLGIQRRLRQIERDMAAAAEAGSDATLEDLQAQHAAHESRWRESARVPVATFASATRSGYGLFLLDASALGSEPARSETLRRLEEGARAYRIRAESAREKLAAGVPARRDPAKVAGALARIRADAEHCEAMTLALDRLVERIEAGELAEAQSLADAKWAEVYGP